MSTKIKDLIAVIIIQLVLTLPFYTASVYGATISNVRVTKLTSNSATIEWNTDNASNGRVRYGRNTSLGFTQRHDNFIENHSIIVSNSIDTDTNYFFSVESTDLAGNTAIDNNSNNLYTFKTTDIKPPPQVIGLRQVSTTQNSISLSWNSLNITDLKYYIVYRNRVAIANTMSNSYNDTNLTADMEFGYKVSAVDNSSNEGPQSDTLIASKLGVDSTSPLISNIDILPITDTTAKVTWLTNENATTTVLYGVNKTDKTKSANEFVTNHSITIDGLTKGLTYFFIVESCDLAKNCANSTNQSFLAGRDITPPSINVSIPRFVNRRVIDIISFTEPFAKVSLFVNDLNIPKRSLSSDEVGKTGKFIFSQVQLEQNNIIKLVAVDKFGNRNEKTFEVSIDTEKPTVKLNEIPPATFRPNLTIIGVVNKFVTIKVFVDVNVNESFLPSKITGLNATKIGQNSVELHWDESKDKDFSHYVVYRDDIAIALTKPANFNLFIDALVDSGKSYAYKVSAVNIFGNEGPKSEPITVTTLKGGAILNLKYPQVDILEDFRKPFLITNASGSFNFGVQLSKGDAAYKIKLVFEDLAQNDAIVEKSVILDTKKSEVKIISPRSDAFIFENVANAIDIIGKAKPNARVHLFVNRTPCTSFDKCFEISGVGNELQDIPESQIDSKCRLESAGKSFCKTGADFSVDADSQGNFKFEKVDLTAMFGGAARVREVSETEIRNLRVEEGKESIKTTLVVIATDKLGRRGIDKQTVSIGTCWSGNQSWDIIPLTRWQSPALLSTERLAEGKETLYFYFNYSYIGRGTTPSITSVSLLKACGTKELIDPRFNISCMVMPSGNSPKLLNPPENTISYSAVPLSRFPGMDKFLEDDWKGFFKAIHKELTFPFQVRIRYKHDINNDGTLETETQTSCEEVSYVVDNSIVDPRKVLPDWLLTDFVDILQNSIKTLTDVQNQINKVLDYVAIGCLASWGLNFVFQIIRRIDAFWVEKTYAIKDAAKLKEFLGTFTLANKDNEEHCKELIQDIAKEHNGFRLKYVNDIDLQKCFPTTAALWNREATAYIWSRWSCDRVFGHAAPAGWTETKSDEDLLNRISKGEGCAVDESVKGEHIRAESCADIARKYPAFKEEASKKGDAKCTIVKTGGKEDSLYTIGELVSEPERLYKIQLVKGPVSQNEFAIKIKQSEVDYLTAQIKSCAELCGVKGNQVGTFTGADGTPMTVSITPPPKKDEPKTQDSNQPKPAGPTNPLQPAKPMSGCTTVNNCISFNRNEKIYISDKDGNKDFKVISAITRGYASDCFYNPNKDTPPSVVSDSPAQRFECCCINAIGGAPSKYYKPDDVDTITKEQVHESKTTPLTPAKSQSTDDPLGYSDMKWSYRYWKEKFQATGTDGNPHFEYNPNRYIEGKDLPACFGQNNILYGEKALTIDPFKQHEAAIQCAHLAGISNRIQFIKNLMSQLSTCLVQVRTTGRADAGACKELFTQYLCNALWQIIRYFVSGCIPIGFGIDESTQSENVLNYVRGGLKGIYDSVSDLQSQITNEYGNTKLNELLGVGEESIARKICLGAFGYDWEFNLKSVLDAAYATPFATFVQTITGSREFLTVEPGSLKAKYEYRASWTINPGCDFERYDVYLTCVGRKEIDKYPNSVKCGAIGAPSIAYTGQAPFTGPSAGYSQCDCAYLPQEKPGDLVFSGRLKKNILEDNVIPANKRVITSDFRYDHLKFVLRPERKITEKIKPNCFPTGYDEGIFYFPLIDKSPKDIVGCRVDWPSGSFVCGEGATLTTKKGIAHFTEVKVNNVNSNERDKLVFGAGEPINIEATIRKIGQDKCLRVLLDGVEKEIVGVVVDGPYTYPINLPGISLGQEEQIAGDKQGLNIVEFEANNQKEVGIKIIFYDTDNNGEINFLLDDEVSVDDVKTRIKESRYFDSTQGPQGAIVIQKNEVKLKIIGATLPITNTGEKKKSVGGTIVIRTAAQISTTPKSQTRNLKLELYNLKQEAESYGYNPENCNLGDAAIGPDGTTTAAKRDIPLKIELRKSKEAALQGPVMQSVSVTPLKIKKGDIVKISVVFGNPNEVDDKNVDFNYKRPDGVEGNTANLKKNDKGIFEAFISTDTLGNAGQYTGEIIAKSKNPDANPSKKEVKFDVQCGGEKEVYGICKPYGSCPQDRWIGSGLVCKGAEEGASTETSEVCCRT